MALGNNDISITLVKNAIGESLSNVGGLVLSGNVNRWGINTPSTIQQVKYWGVISPPAPHELGMFRGYDHYWRCYGIGACYVSPNLSTYLAGEISIDLKWFPSWSVQGSTITHYFDVYVSRDGNFVTSGHYTKIGTNVPQYNDSTYALAVNPLYPPDGGSALSYDSTFYLKFKYISSGTRGFDKNNFTPSSHITSDVTDPDAWIISMPIGHPSVTYTNAVTVSSGEFRLASKYSGGNFMYFDLHFLNTWSVVKHIGYVRINISNGAKSTTIDVNINQDIPAGSISGGNLIAGALNTYAYQLVSLSSWNLDQSFVGKVSMDAGATWTTGFNWMITEDPKP
jgi:hypothetical protein